MTNGPTSESQLAVYHFDYITADPDCLALLAHMNAAGALERRALRCNVGGAGESCGDEPLSEARVEAAGDGILESAGADERTYLERRVVTRFMRADDAELERGERCQSGFSDSTLCADRSMTAHQPGPLSIH